jgi:putative transposase
MKEDECVRLLAYVTGLVNQELLLQNEYMAAENRILRAQALIVQMAQENSGWGYERIVCALANLSYDISGQTVGNILKRQGIAPAPKRSQNTAWKEFIHSHMAVLAGIDFFTVEVLSCRGLVTYYVLFLIHLESRRVSVAGITRHPGQAWMRQMARNATGEDWGFLELRRYVLHDRDTKFCSVFRDTLEAGGIKPIQLPARSPNLNAYAERCVRSVKEECLSKLILFGEASLRRALAEFVDHFHGGEEPSGERERSPFSRRKRRAPEAPEPSALSQATWGIVEVLRLCRMSIFAKRHRVPKRLVPPAAHRIHKGTWQS